MALVLTGCFSRTPTNEKKKSSSTTTAQTSTSGGSTTSGGSSGTSGGTSGGSSGGTSSGTSGTTVVPPGPSHNYGTADDPLTVAEGRALLDKENPTKQKMFVTGVVKRNAAWSTDYKNIDIWITDPNGTDEFEIFRCGTLPSGYQPAQPGENALVGKTVVATGTGKIFNSTYELDKGCEVLSITDVAPTGITITSGSSLVVGGQLELTATVTPSGASQNVTWSIDSGSGATLDGNVLTGTAAGSVVVRATATGTNVTTTKTVTITAPSQKLIESITPNPTSLDLTVGDEPAEIGLTILPSDYQESVSWSVKEGEGVVSIDSNHKVVAETAGSAVVRIEGVTSHNGVDVPVTVHAAQTSIADVYAAAVAAGGSETAKFAFSGVVTAIQGKSFYIQEDGHGMLIYNKEVSGIAVGKIVDVVATVYTYNGLPETKTIESATLNGDGVVPTPITVSSMSSIGDANVLASAANAVFKSKDNDWTSSKASLAVFTIGTDDITVKFDKYGYDATKAGLLNTATAGKVFNLTNIVTSVNNGTKQLGFSGTSLIEEVTADPTGVTITSGDSVTVGSTLNLTATVQPEGASQAVTWAIKSGSEYASLAANVLTGTAAGTVVVTATAAGTTVSTEKSITVEAAKLTSLSFKESSYSLQAGATKDMNDEINLAPDYADYDLSFEIKESVESTISGSVLTISGNDDQFHVIVNDSVSGLTDECTIDVVTEKTLSSISLDTTNVKTVFNVGEEFTSAGLVVTANYSDSTSQTVTPTSVSTPDMTSAGEKTVTVSYTEGTVTKTADYTITVKSATEDHTLTWTATAAANLGTQISAQGGTATGKISTGSYEWDYTRTLVTLTSGKSDYISWQGATWIQLGSNNALESLSFTTSAIPGTIKSITVVTATAGTHTLSINVGGSAYLTNGALTTYSGTVSATNPDPANCAVTATGTSSGAITITIASSNTTTKKAMVIRSITVVANY